MWHSRVEDTAGRWTLPHKSPYYAENRLLRYLQGACQAGEGLHAQQVEQHDARAGVMAAVVEGRDVRVCKRVVPLLEELRPQQSLLVLGR